jgi:hypothetical protein
MPRFSGAQWPPIQTALREGGSSQWAASHFHCPDSMFQRPDIQTYPDEGGGARLLAPGARDRRLRGSAGRRAQCGDNSEGARRPGNCE